MPILNLRVGETYVTRSGDLVRITSEKTHTRWPWRYNGSNGEIYSSDGRCGIILSRPHDIIKASDKKMFGNVQEVFDSLAESFNQRFAA